MGYVYILIVENLKITGKFFIEIKLIFMAKKLKIDSKLMYKKFHEIWDKQETNGYCICYATGVKLYRNSYRDNSCVYHHVLLKSKYPQYALEEWNIVIVHPDAHTQVHSNIRKCPKIMELTEKLKEEFT
mgnify:CR=1 FL=1